MYDLVSIKYIKDWDSINEMIEYCNHVLSHSERYVSERIEEAKKIINDYNGN